MAVLNVKVDSKGAKAGAKQVKTAIKDIGTEADKTTRKVETSTKKMSSSFKKMKQSALGLKGLFVGLGIAAAGVAIIKTGAQFEKSMKVVYGVTRATVEQQLRLEAVARKMGATTEFTAGQAADALSFLGMAGFGAEKSIQALPGVLDLATAGNIELGRAADIASNALTAMQLPVRELGRVNDVFVATITRSNTNMEMMAESFKYSAPAAAAFGYSIEELSGLIGILGNAGIQGSMAGTQLSFAFTRAQKVFDELGMDGSGKGLVEALQAANDAGWDTGKMLQVFGQRGGRAALVLRDLIPELKILQDDLKNSKGEAKALADTMRDTLIGDFKLLQSAASGAAIEIFKVLGPEMRTQLQEMTAWINENKQAIQSLASAMLALAKGITTVIQAGATFTDFMGSWAGALGTAVAENDLTSMSGIGNAIRQTFSGEALTKNAIMDARMTKGKDKAAARQRKEAAGVGPTAAEVEKAKKKIADVAKRAQFAMLEHEAKEQKKASEQKNTELERYAEEWMQKKRDFGKTEKEIALMDLQEEYDFYAQVAKDKVTLEKWRQNEIALIQAAEDERLKEISDKQKAVEKDAADKQKAELEKQTAERAKVADFFADKWTNAFMSMIDGSKSFGQAMQDMGRDVVMQLTQMVIKAILFKTIMSAMGMGGGAAGGLMQGMSSLFHGGGQVGAGGAQRRVSAMAYATAPRLHSGLRNDEYPAVLQKGEEVLSKQEASGGSGGGLTIYNIVDPALVTKAMATAEGKGAVVNVIRGDAEKVNKALKGSK